MFASHQPGQSQTLLLHGRPLPGQSSISCRPSHFFSTAYKMLLPQLLCFDNDPFSWGGVPPNLRTFHVFPSYPLSFHTLAHSLRKTTRGGGCFLLTRRSVVDDRHEPLGDQVRVLIPVLLFTDHSPLITARFFPLQKDSSVSATQHRAPLVGRASEPDDRRTVRREARLSRVVVGRREPK